MVWLDHFSRDIRHAARAITRMPGLATVVIVSLAIGIGVNAAIFSWIQGLVFKPLPGVRDVDRTRFFFKRKGLRLEANHRYRVAAVYDNPRSSAITGAMGLLVGVFAPENASQWPVVDATDVNYQRDLAWLLEFGDPGADESHHPAE